MALGLTAFATPATRSCSSAKSASFSKLQLFANKGWSRRIKCERSSAICEWLASMSVYPSRFNRCKHRGFAKLLCVLKETVSGVGGSRVAADGERSCWLSGLFVNEAFKTVSL